jgi:hypothetical protein
MEMIWRPKSAMGKEYDLFTHVNYFHYEAPPGYCFDINCHDDPIMDDPDLENYNLDAKADAFVDYFRH